MNEQTAWSRIQSVAMALRKRSRCGLVCRRSSAQRTINNSIRTGWSASESRVTRRKLGRSKSTRRLDRQRPTVYIYEQISGENLAKFKYYCCATLRSLDQFYVINNSNSMCLEQHRAVSINIHVNTHLYDYNQHYSSITTTDKQIGLAKIKA